MLHQRPRAKCLVLQAASALRSTRLAARHRFTAFRAGAARPGTARHRLVISESFAFFRAATADFGAGAAGDGVDGGTAQHGVGAGAADVGTGRKQGDVIGAGVFPTHFQAVGDGFQADGVAVRAVFDAVVHGVAAMFGGVVAHGGSGGWGASTLARGVLAPGRGCVKE